MKKTKKNTHKDEIIASIFIKYKGIEYGVAIVIPDDKRFSEYVRDQGHQFIDAAIRTIEREGGLTSAKTSHKLNK